MAAWTDSFGTATGDAWLLKLDVDGQVTSEAVIGEPENAGADGAVIAADGGALFVGRNAIDIFLKQDAWAVRVDAAGAIQWGRLLAFVGLGRSFLTDAAEASGGDWFLCGTSAANDFPPQHAWLVRMDDLGNVLWQQEHGSGASDSPNSIVATSDGGAIVAGTTNSGGNDDVLLVKYDSAGGIDWQRQLGGPDTEQGEEVIALTGGGYAVAGWTTSFTASGRAPWLMRFDSAGTLLWHQVYGDMEWGDFQSLTETADGDIVAFGRIGEPGFPTNDLWLVKVAAGDGAVQWERAYEGESGDYADTILELGDEGLLLGATWGWGFPEESVWLLRTLADGTMPGCSIVRDTNLAVSSPRVVPNPGPLMLQAPQAGDLPQGFTDETGGAVVVERCGAASCPPLSCEAITVMPNPTCEGTSVTLTAELTGGEGAIEVLWDVLPDPAIDAMGNPAVLELGPGTHDIVAIVTDSCADPSPQQCSMMTSVTVHPDMTPAVTADGPLSFCATTGESVTLDAGAGYASYQWLLDGVELMTETGRTVEAMSSGDWTVRVLDANGCSWTSAPVTVNAGDCAGCPALSCDGIEIVPEPACEGEEQVFTAIGGGGEGTLTFEWDFDGDGLTDVVGSPAAWTFGAGSWPVSLTVSDACASPGPQGCTIMTTATVHPDQTPVITPDGPTRFCASAGESLNLDAGPGLASYEWSLDGAPIPMSDSQVIPALASGSYTVTVVDGNGCTWTSAPLVVQADACDCANPLQCQDIVVEPALACEGDEQSFRVVFADGLGPFEIAWDFDEDGMPDASGNPVLHVLPAGTTRVAVTVIDTGCPPFPNPGCTLQLDVTVDPTPAPVITPNGPATFCADMGESVSLVADAGFASYQWMLNGVDLPGETGETLVVALSGSYSVRVSSGSGCEGGSASLVVDASACGAACTPLTCDGLLIEPGPPCDELLYTLTVMASGGEGVLAVDWDLDGDGLPDASGSPVQVRLPPGMQTVEATVTDACADPGPQQCSIAEPVTVPEPAAPPLEVSDVTGGETPLLLLDSGTLLVFEEEATALAYSLHVGEIGSWYGAHAAGGSDCHRLDAVSGGDGTASLAVDLPVDGWVLVSAADACFEGSVGTDSFGAPRSGASSWQDCGPLP
jgi:hypothetical protein